MCEQTDEQPLISIIVPCKEIDQYTKDCVEHCKQLDYWNYEILLLPDHALKEIDGVIIIPTGSVTPGAKRNIGVARSKGEICAFIDSDAYPRRDWLSKAIKYLHESQVVAVGGPGLTPSEDDLIRKASGQILSSFMVGNLSNRYKSKRYLESDDIHSCNLIVRKSVLIEAGGWNEKYWPGEDTLICSNIKKLGRKLIEASDVVVYHHRRPLFREHLRQISKFGMHRGFFAKKYRGNSLKLVYFAPSLFLFFLSAGLITSFFSPLFVHILLVSIMAYLVLCFIATLSEVDEAKSILTVWLGIIITHMLYGASFLAGLLKRDLKR